MDADFFRRKEFGYSWTVCGGTVTVRISDYLSDAPDAVLEDLMGMISLRASGKPWAEPQSFLDHVRSDEFVTGHRPTYISRSKNLSRTDIGECRSLHDSVQRLLDSGLLEEADVSNSYISWTGRDNRRRVGFCSTMFRVVGISRALDSEDIPEEVLDYVVYHECLHLRRGYSPDRRHHDRLFRQWEHAYPGWSDAESVLRKL